MTRAQSDVRNGSHVFSRPWSDESSYFGSFRTDSSVSLQACLKGLRKTRWSFLLIGFLAILSPALAEDKVESAPGTDWSIEETDAATIYTVEGDNSRLTVECVSERYGGGATLDVVVDGSDPQAGTTTSIFVGDEIFTIHHGFAGVGVTDCPKCASEFDALWQALRKDTVEEIDLKHGQKRRYVNVRGGDEALGACVPDFDARSSNPVPAESSN